MEQSVDQQKLRASIERLGDAQQQIFFFQRLTNPKLFDALRAIGEFSHPPPARREGNRIWHLPWPPAIYLTNVAARVPTKVAEVLSGIDTDNRSVVLDLLNAVVAMPVEISKALIEPMRRWLDADPEFLVYRYLDLIDYFVKGGEITSARQLSVTVLAVVPGPERPDIFGRPLIEAVAKVGDSHYDFVIGRVAEALISVVPLDLLQILARRLREAIDIEYKDKDDELSYIWARDLEREALGFGAKEELTHNLFKLSLAAVENSYASLADILALLRKFGPEVFRRVRAMLVAKIGEIDDARAVLAEESFYSSREVQRERGIIFDRFYSDLTPEEQTTVLAEIRSNVISEQRLKDFYGNRLSGAELKRAIKDSREQDLFQELEPFSERLTDKIAHEYADLRRRFERTGPGPKEGEVWHGPTSPNSLEEFTSMSTPQILSFLERWIPKVGDFEPSPEGVGRTLQPVIESRIPEFLAARERVHQLAPRYVRHIVDAIRGHVHAQGFDFEAYVDLLGYASLADSASVAARFSTWDESDEERGLPAARQAIAFALTDMFKAKVLPAHLRDRVWSIISAIVEDPDPSVEDDERYTGDSAFGQPWNLALNSARGAGMLAAFDYARWVKSYHTEEPDLLSLAPELFEMLDRKLDPGIEATCAIRSTFGQNFVSIFALSRSWTRPAIDRIFSDDNLGESAWNAYLVFNNLYSEIYDLIKDRYARATATVASQPIIEKGHWDPTAALGGHIAGAYAWGRFGLENGSLIDIYLRNAPSDAVERTLRSIGSGLSSTGMSDETVRKFQKLYEHVLSIFEYREFEERKDVLEIFGLWFISDRLDPDWALRNLTKTLRLTGGKTAIDIRVIEKLAELSDSRPDDALQSFDALIGSVFLFHLSNQPAVRQILLNAASADEQTRKSAIAVNDRLANMGILDYLEIFQP